MDGFLATEVALWSRLKQQLLTTIGLMTPHIDDTQHEVCSDFYN